MHNPIYLGHNATILVDTQIADAIEPYLREYIFANPSSNHVYGPRAHEAVEKAHHQAAILLSPIKIN